MVGAKRGGGRGEKKTRKRRKGKGASVPSDEQKEVLIAGVPYPLSPIPLLFPPYPCPFRRLLRGLGTGHVLRQDDQSPRTNYVKQPKKRVILYPRLIAQNQTSLSLQPQPNETIFQTA